jgi:hypothetical protein
MIASPLNAAVITADAAAAPAAAAVPRFGVFDIALTAAGAPAATNPYTAIEAAATITRPDGVTRTIPLFWDGARTWRLRISPDLVGPWRWSIHASDPGLDGKTGAFQCIPSQKKGSIRPMAGNPRHFQFQNGDPFYFLGDTAWALYQNNSEEKLDRTSVLYCLNVRAKQGFSVIHSMLISEADWGNDGGMPFHDLSAERINPAYWQEVDARVKHLTDRGMIAGLVLAWTDHGKSKQSWQYFPSEEACRRYARFIVARYSAYPVFFIVAGEWGLTKDDVAARRLYEAVGTEIKKHDPHNRMVAIHTDGRGPQHLKPFARSPWNDFGDYMQTYDNLHSSILYCRDVGKPLVNAEYAYYRREAADGTVNKANSADVDIMRAATWDIVMAGGYVVTGFGTTYFGGNRCRGPFDVDTPKNDDWKAQAQVMRAFFTARAWWKLEPADELLTAPMPRGADEDVVVDSRGRPPRTTYWALAEPGRQYIVYVRGLRRGVCTLTMGGDAPSPATYTIRRFDPRTGEYMRIGNHRGQGPILLQTPDDQDWVFEVSAPTA